MEKEKKADNAVHIGPKKPQILFIYFFKYNFLNFFRTFASLCRVFSK